MKLLFIAFENMETGSSQLERLEYQLTTLSKNNKISILCLNQNDNTYAIKQKYHQVTFYYHRIEYNGWNVLNTEEIIRYVKNIDEQNNFDLIIQMMEVWDLLREFSLSFYKTRKFVAIIHAMPFLGTPINLKKDINIHCKERLKKLDKKSMKYEYIINHYKEVSEVFDKMKVIAANNTVAYYLQHYLKNIEFWTFESFYPKKEEISKTETNSFDFLYMARIEEGKGLEYLEDIFSLWIFHINLAGNEKLATSWYAFFNLINIDEFSKEDLMNILLEKLTPLAEEKAIPERSLRDDISVLLNMYVKEKQQNYDPEENKISPFAQLGLLKKDRNNYIKTQPDKDKLCDDAVLYSLIKFFEKKEVDSIGIDELLNSPMSPGRILNLKRMALNEYLDNLEGQGYLTVNRTAGLDMVYLKKKIELKEVVSNYYKKH